MPAAAIARYLEHLRVERRVSPHTLAAYAESLQRLERLAAEAQRPLARVETAHVRRFAAQLLFEAIDGKPRPGTHSVATRLVTRGTTAPGQ